MIRAESAHVARITDRCATTPVSFINYDNEGHEVLQIISGRFFSGGRVNAQEADAVLYSNLGWSHPIETSVAALRPAGELGHAVSCYVVRFTVRYEPRPDDAMVLPAADQAIDQFRLLASFWFKAVFHPDRQHVETLCRSSARNSIDDTIPNKFVPGFFELSKWSNAAAVEGFIAFVKKILSIPRQHYRLIISCLSTFFDALDALSTNFDLAYGMMAYVLEALSQKADGYTPEWHDYDPQLRDALDEVLRQINPDSAESIKSTLLRGSHLKLMKRFTGFVADHVSDEFFTTDVEKLIGALPKSRAVRALQNLYKSRSGFVHQLTTVHEHLRVPWENGFADVFEWDGEPYFTFAGLVRLVHHVLSHYIERQANSEREEYPKWREELPGIVRVNLAPRYWIWQVGDFSPKDARQRLRGLLQHILEMLSSTKREMPDMSSVMRAIEAQAKTANVEALPAMLAMYRLYHRVVPQNNRPGWQDFMSKFENDSLKCSIEMLAIWPFISDETVPWLAVECISVFELYRKRMFHRGAIQLPSRIETAIMAIIANRCYDAGDIGQFDVWIRQARLEAAGHPKLQAILETCRAGQQQIRIRRLIEPEASEVA